MKSLIANLRRLVIPWGAPTTAPRVVIATDDELASLIGQDASITWYYGPSRGFVLSVEASGPNRGQWHFWGSDGARIAQFIDIDFDNVDPTQDRMVLGVSGGTLAFRGDQTVYQSALGGWGIDGLLIRGDPFVGVPVARLLTDAGDDALGVATAFTTGTVVASFQVTTVQPNARLFVNGTCDFDCTGFAAGSVAIGRLSLNGVTQPKEILFEATAVNLRATVAQSWILNLAATGTYTIDLTALRTGAGGWQAGAPHTNLVFGLHE